MQGHHLPSGPAGESVPSPTVMPPLTGTEGAAPHPQIKISLPTSLASLELRSAEVSSTALTSSATLRLTGSLGAGRMPFSPMIDSGATACFMDTALAHRCNLPLSPTTRTVRLADGTERPAAGTVRVTCALRAASGPPVPYLVEFCVTPLQGYCCRARRIC